MLIHNHEQNSPEWLNARLGLVTASSASKLLTGTGANPKSTSAYYDHLAQCKYLGEDIDAWDGNKYTERGHEVEPKARNWYAYQKGVNVTEVGFCTDDLGRYGCSPDGLIGEPDAWIKGVEFKCFPKLHLQAIMYCDKHNRIPPANVTQVQMNMLVCEVPEWDVVYYHEKLPSKIMTVQRDDDFIALLLEKILTCNMKRDEIVKTIQQMEHA